MTICRKPALGTLCCLCVVVCGSVPAGAEIRQSPIDEPRVLHGTYTHTDFPPAQPDGINGVAVAPRSPIADLAVLSKNLEETIAVVPADEMIRVIIALRHLPQDRISADVQARHAGEMAAIQAEVDVVLAAAASRRDPRLPRDADNHPELIRTMPQELEALRPLNLRREALDRIIIRELAAEVAIALAPTVGRVRAAIEGLGGSVEFSTIAGSLVVARVPAGRIAELATYPDVLGISEDVLLESTLDIMDDAALVSAPGGLWDSGFDGGLFDPAIIDTGTDIYHPGMSNDTSPARTNFYTWFLTAAAADPRFDDLLSQDDLHGHGTHVAGIVGCYGSVGYEDRLGMAHGVDKLVTLKAGWRTDTGAGAMFESDMMGIVDKALYHGDQLFPLGTFADDVDGMNLSFGSDTNEDETVGSRFWDSVVSSYPDLPVTLSAGNRGAGDLKLGNFAVSYNGITVANVSPTFTPERIDDQIDFTSSSGPTASGRRKPDLAAPGHAQAPNNDWETENDYVYKSGTSMAAPSVLGVIISLMDAGVADELALKALLVNTAQKNEPGIDIESDEDGWDRQIGFGYMNALAAFGHRSDVFLGVLPPRGAPGDYRLYTGVMRDEGPTGEGRDRATMLWNRHATYDPAGPPTTYYTLVDLNLQLFHEADGALVDFDVTPLDNVQQVRIEPGAAATGVVVKAYAWSTSFSHGGATESFALATEEGFAEVSLPDEFTGEGVWPSSVEPDETFIVALRVRNGAEVASHGNTFDLDLPAGWSLLTGAATQNVGSAPGSDGTSAYAVWEIQAPSLNPPGPVVFPVYFTHDSYGEPWGTLTFDVGLTLEWDTTPPRPDPMYFTAMPAAEAVDEIRMQAAGASDLHHEPVDYLHEFRSSPTGGAGGSSSGWHRERDYADLGLDANNDYCYRVLARDSATVPNTTAPSPEACAYTVIESPLAPLVTPTSTTALHLESQGSFTNLDQGLSGLRIVNLTQSTDSGWVQGPVSWTSDGLAANSSYQTITHARNGDGLEARPGPVVAAYTLIEAPQAPSPTVTGPTTVDVQSQGAYSNLGASASGLRIDNLTQGTDSGWVQGSVSWTSDGLTPNSGYDFAARSRNGNGFENPPSPVASVLTLASDPAPAGFGTVTHESVVARWSANGNPTGTEYLAENTTTGADSGWTTALEWHDGSTGPSSFYDYRVRARNAEGHETAVVPLGTVETGFFGDGFESGATGAWSTAAP